MGNNVGSTRNMKAAFAFRIKPTEQGPIRRPLMKPSQQAHVALTTSILLVTNLSISNRKRAQPVAKISMSNPSRVQQLFTSSLKRAQPAAMILMTVPKMAQLPILMILGSEELILYDSSLKILLRS